ncbi:uncharacterized protein LOC126842924 isoform X1 [Adelges cooleyi]|uniref:uncharacterized protein LOC126842924 isoform X1 n=1 Tax=Adelges cooleyi TaxID=133065 RepID=UPI00217F988C|nr:uncharacterized protein LOC126842924 isoform X1 [Adelges cooleyi]
MTAIKAYFTVLVVVVFYQTTTLGKLFSRSTSSDTRRFMKFLPNSVESLDTLVVQGGDAVKAKSYDKLVEMYKDNHDKEALMALTKNAHILSFNYKNSSASLKSTKNLWGFKQGIQYADQCIIAFEGNPADLYECLKWKAALIETDIFEGNVKMNLLNLGPLKKVLDRMDAIKEKNPEIPDDPYVTFLKGRIICEIKLITEESGKIVQKTKELLYGSVINHDQESIQTCIKTLKDYESQVGDSGQLIESKLLLGKAFIAEREWPEAQYWLQKAVDIPVRDTKGKMKNEEARSLLENLQLNYFSRNIIL